MILSMTWTIWYSIFFGLFFNSIVLDFISCCSKFTDQVMPMQWQCNKKTFSNDSYFSNWFLQVVLKIKLWNRNKVKRFTLNECGLYSTIKMHQKVQNQLKWILIFFFYKNVGKILDFKISIEKFHGQIDKIQRKVLLYFMFKFHGNSNLL